MNELDIKEIIINHSQKAPVKLTPILKDLKIDLYVALFENQDKWGHIENNEGQYEIVINKEQSFERKRFTVAHEIAHFILHRNMIDERAKKEKEHISRHKSDSTPRGIDNLEDFLMHRKIEAEANEKATNILMPTVLIRDAIKNIEKESSKYTEREKIEKMAKLFEVSFQAMAIRLQKTEYIY